MTKAQRRVAIIHPWYPAYRQAFVERLIVEAARREILVDFYHGDPAPSVARRSDSVAPASGIRLPTRFVPVAGKYFEIKNLRKLLASKEYDLVILEQAVKNIETYQLLISRYRNKLAFWGHGKSYTQSAEGPQERVKQWLTARGKWFFAYTQGGAAAVKAAGFPSDRITVVNNSIDSRRLRDSIAGLSEDKVAQFVIDNGLHGDVCVFIGGIDDSKRLEFLIDAGDELYRSNPAFKLLVLGDGDRRAFVTEASSTRPWLVYLGSARGEVKALSLKCAKLVLMPGRVGLVAVDSFAALTPIVTTDWQWHAPEFEYLEHGRNSLISDNEIMSFTGQVRMALNDDDLHRRLVEGCDRSFRLFSVERMSENFLEGLIGALNETERA